MARAPNRAVGTRSTRQATRLVSTEQGYLLRTSLLIPTRPRPTFRVAVVGEPAITSLPHRGSAPRTGRGRAGQEGRCPVTGPPCQPRRWQRSPLMKRRPVTPSFGPDRLTHPATRPLDRPQVTPGARKGPIEPMATTLTSLPTGQPSEPAHLAWRTSSRNSRSWRDGQGGSSTTFRRRSAP